ncbi:hypothetical protein ACWD7F_05230 [Streptomyces sp. NPDC005122]
MNDHIERRPLETTNNGNGYVRARLDALLSAALSTVEREGVTRDGVPHPMLGVIASLVSAGTGIRTLALDRKLHADDFETRQEKGQGNVQ